MASHSYQSTKKLMGPYLAGVLLGLVVLSSFIIAGRGVGASGTVNQFTALTV